MTEDFNLEALRYLLDELDAVSRANFEALLARDPVARAALKACSSALAQFAAENAPAEAMPLTTQRAALSAILTTVAAEPRSQPPRFTWKRLAWPLAASLLLLLNLLQYFRSVSLRSSQANGSSVTASSGHAPSGNTPSSHERKIPAQISSSAKNDPRGLQIANQADAGVTDELHRLEKLRAEYANLERARETLSAEYNGIIRQLAERTLINKGVGRLAAMELVDAASYARGERKGLVDIARGLLTEPGIVTVEPVPTPQVPPTKSNPTPDPVVPPVDPNASTIPNLPVTPLPPQSNQPTNPPTDTPQTSTQGKTQPYAWSVFDEASSRGYLNLYNLPAPPADQSLQLWVKVVNSDTYQRVGEVPAQFYGGSGSLSYNLPGETQTPTDILVTQEPRNATPAKPTGPTILHGP